MPNQEAYQLRYVFGYAMDGSDLPCTCFGPLGLWSNPSGALTPGKVIGLDWTNVRSCLGGN